MDLEYLSKTHLPDEIPYLQSICFEFFNFLHIPYSTMDSSPKKQHLTWQFLMDVTRKEGPGWEANLLAHVSEVLFISTTFLNPLLYYIYWGKLRWQSFKKDLLCKWRLLSYQVTSVHFIPLFPTEPLPRDHVLETLWELWVQEKNPMPDKIGIDAWLLSPQYDGNCRLLDAFCSP